jgi:hypothetical protein
MMNLHRMALGWACLVFLALLSGCNSKELALWEAIDRIEVGNVARLLQDGADPNSLPEGKDRLPIEIAAEKGNAEIVQNLLQHGARPDSAIGDEKPLWLAMVNGHEEAATALVKAGANVHGPMQNGFSPLYFAALQGYKLLAAQMLEKGAEVHSPGPAGTPLHEAAENGDLILAKLLVEHGAQIDRINADGESPAFLALDNGQPGLLQWLLDNEADPNLQNELGNTLLILAADHDDTLAIQLLCAAGANAGIQNLAGETAMHQAAAKGNLAAAKVLVRDCNAPLNQQDARGLSPAGLAFREGQTELVDFLTSLGGRLR